MDTYIPERIFALPPRSLTLTLSSAAIVLWGCYKLYGSSVIVPSVESIIPSPRDTLIPQLSEAEQLRLPYPPNLLPGARDVRTPFGTIRVYEWGPENGKKVVFVHGDSTPAPVWAKVVDKLANNGYRVLCFDLYGRGYSDTPAHLSHGSQLFVLQLLFAINSSPLSWTGKDSDGFSLVGFSYGGIIALDFLRTFPHLVNSIVILAPAGLLRELPSSYTRFWYRFPDLIPTRYMKTWLAEALGVETRYITSPPPKDPTKVDSINLQAICQWQFDHHQGHIVSFLSTIRSGSQIKQETIWKEACDVVKERASRLPEAEWNAKGGRLLLLNGAEDYIVPPNDVEEDLERLLGKQNYVSHRLPGGHGFVWSNSKTIADILDAFWK